MLGTRRSVLSGRAAQQAYYPVTCIGARHLLIAGPAVGGSPGSVHKKSAPAVGRAAAKNHALESGRKTPAVGGEANKEPKSKQKRDPKTTLNGKKSNDRSASGERHGKRTGPASSPGPAVGGSPPPVLSSKTVAEVLELPAQAAKKCSSRWRSCCRLKQPQSWSIQVQGQRWQSCTTR